MNSVAELQQRISELPKADCAALAAWMESQDDAVMSAAEEAELLASLDKAARQLDSGQGGPIERARDLIAKWTTK
jgi:hypothetical protein